ncbi:MAG: carbon-nitrogen hydrolase family protein, partial [Chloroflexi bacterium]|nr:carbon-nitrogen hydrolase family protein [Chloroflexota bacterium]
MSFSDAWPKFTAAAVQAGPVLKDAPQFFDARATLDKAVSLIEEAGRNGTRLIVFPECWMPSFPYWCLDYRDRGRFVDIWAKFLRCSVEVPGPETEALCAAAKRANAYVVMGINERDARYPARMYNSMVYLSPQGTVMGTHRKICNTVQERLFHTPGDGGDNLYTVFKTGIGALGGSMCGEHSQLLLVYHWIMQGVQVHCSLWPGRRGLEAITDVRTRATSMTAGAYCVLAATYMSEKDQPKDFYPNSLFSTPDGFKGGSGIVSPSGEYVAGPVFDREAIVYGEIDLANTDRSRASAALTGIYSRWDLLSLNVQQAIYTPSVPVTIPLWPKGDLCQPLPLSQKVADPSLPLSQKGDTGGFSLEDRLKRLEQEIAALREQAG